MPFLQTIRRKAGSLWQAARPQPRPGQTRQGRLFCAQPFERFEVLGGGGERGEVFFCCQNWIKKSIGNMAQKSVQDVWNGKAARDIRRSILDGSFKYCRADLCPYLQNVDGPVQRIEDVKDERLLDIIQKELTIIPYGPRDIICCFDQSCNLSCPTCRTRIIMETDHGDAIVDIQKRLESEALADARLLYITGSGDPFGSPYFRQWLQTMKRAQMPNLERIHLHTNGLLWTKRIWESIPAETRTLIKAATISIDAARPQTYSENRRGGDFDTLLERLGFIAELRQNGPLDYLEIHMTVQANNFEEMPEFIMLGKRHHCDRITFHQMVDWGTFSSEEYKARAIQNSAHAEHAVFLKTLVDPMFDDPNVYLSNLSDIRSHALSARISTGDHETAS